MSQPLKNKKVFLFDFDGTLINSMGNLADEAASLMAEHYVLSFAEARQKYVATSGLPFAEQLAVLFPDQQQNSRVAAAFENKKLDYYPALAFFPDVMAGLAVLKKHGLRLAISSNNGQEVVDTVLQDRQINCFDLVMGYQQHFAKGEQHFNRAMSYFKITKADLVFMGDSLHDAKLASEFGVDFIGRVGTFSKQDFLNKFSPLALVENLNELAKML